MQIKLTINQSTKSAIINWDKSVKVQRRDLLGGILCKTGRRLGYTALAFIASFHSPDKFPACHHSTLSLSGTSYNFSITASLTQGSVILTCHLIRAPQSPSIQDCKLLAALLPKQGPPFFSSYQ